MGKRRVFITGVGTISGIGNDTETTAESLRALTHGFSSFPAYPPLEDDDATRVKLVSAPKGFDLDSIDFEDWTYPDGYKIRREEMRGLAPHGVYAFCSMKQSVEDAKLEEDEVSNTNTGIYTASAGSPRLLFNNFIRMRELGPLRCPPTGIVSAISGTLSFNLVACFKILGNSCGFSSACASSGHAIGYAYDDVAFGRQDRMFVTAGEDVNYESVVPFTGMRALSLEGDPKRASCPFDEKRNGFVSAGGGVTLVLECEEEVERRGVTPYAELLGWGQASDGHNVAISHPEGEGLIRGMRNALKSADLQPGEIDYVNAHATSTLIGDASEVKALNAVFTDSGSHPRVSSTKAITGHGLSLASALETAIVSLSMRGGFTPGSAHIDRIDPAFESLNVIEETIEEAPKVALSNSSGFGGANVSLLFRNP